MIVSKGRSKELGTDFSLSGLAFASGCSDVIAFLVLDRVFTSGMTGNIALVGIAIGQQDPFAALKPAVALLGFVVGAMIATTVSDPDVVSARPRNGLLYLFVIEIACLGAFAFIWHFGSHPFRPVEHYGLIVLAATGMGIQGVVARHIRSPGIMTIVFTSTLLSVVTSLTAMLLKRSGGAALRLNTLRQSGVFLAYLSGAITAGALVWGGIPVAHWLPVSAVVLAFISYWRVGFSSAPSS